MMSSGQGGFAIAILLIIGLLKVNFVTGDSQTEEEEYTGNGIYSEESAGGIDYVGSMKFRFPVGDMSYYTEVGIDFQKKAENPDIKLSVTELIEKYGYPVESHNVFTDDDYVLTLHRIPYGRHKNSTYNESLPAGQKKPIVLIQHGLCSSSVDWIMHTPDKALPYMLADLAGYDVWLGNSRGNRYSNRHLSMTKKRSRYWDYSWHEIGKYDIPAMIDYILTLTGEEKLDYIGHSMGTTSFFVAMSLRPEYNAKIKKMVALGPAVYMEDMKSPLRYLAPFSTVEKFIYDIIGNGEILPEFILKYLHKFGASACEEDSFSSGICENIMYVVGGSNPSQMNETQLPVILAHTPQTCSTKAGIHYLQSVSSAKFRQYDYGIVGNMIRYSSTKPPEYDLKKVTAPVAIFWADDDVLCDPKGIRRLAGDLPNLIGSIQVDYPKFSHIDFLFAKDADKLIYRQILDILVSGA